MSVSSHVHVQGEVSIHVHVQGEVSIPQPTRGPSPGPGWDLRLQPDEL